MVFVYLIFFYLIQLPQQENSFDCGLFLLHYVELFLEEAPVNFSPFRITKLCNFVSDLSHSIHDLRSSSFTISPPTNAVASPKNKTRIYVNRGCNIPTISAV